MAPPDFSAETLADRVNCHGLGAWIAALGDHAGAVLRAPLGAGRERVAVPLVRLGVTVTLFRCEEPDLPEDDQVVFHRVAFDPSRGTLPFGLRAEAETMESAKLKLSPDTAGGRTVDRRRGDTRVSYFLPQDARAVELTFGPEMVGLAACQVFRLGGEIAFASLDRRFGPLAGRTPPYRPG